MTSSILTNTSAMTALQSLALTQTALNQTETQISTGERVSDAQDNAAYWSIATSMRSDNDALSSVQDSLNLGGSTVGVATAAMNSTISVMDQIKADLVTAAEPGVDRSKIQTDITALQAQLQSIADSASFNGENWLAQNSGAPGYNPLASVVASFSRDSSGNISIGTIQVDTSQTKLYDSNNQSGILDSVNGNTNESIATLNISGLTDSATDEATLSALTSQVDTAIQAITAAASTLGATQTRIELQSTFISSLSDAITTGVGSLVDADMNEASTKLQALQTQQQLGIQSLSIANQNSQLILKLFGGG